MEKNNRKFYEGNARLNKYLFLSQVLYLARFDEKLILDDFVAYENGPVIENIMTQYPLMVSRNETVVLPKNIQEYLNKVYDALKNATYEELIEISYEDPEWIKLHNNTFYAPIMNLEENLEEYKHRYKGLIEALKLIESKA